MLTSEGTTNRSTHIIEDPLTHKLRKLTPIEAESLNGFPDNWTNTGMTDSRRYFMMGNALVTGILNIVSTSIKEIIETEN
jgi:DNA (cytosine-5)-methyltransferase 1